MADISIKDVQKVAKLSGLDLTDAEMAVYRDQFAEILGYIDKLSTIDTKGIEPTYQVTGLSNIMREDDIIDYGVSTEELLKNAPDSENNQIKVKKVL